MLLDFGVEGCRTPSEVCGMPPRVGGRCPTQPLSVQTGAFSTRLVLCPPFQVRPAHPGKPWHESCGFCKKWPQTWCFQVTEIYSLAFFRGQESKIKAQAGLIAPPTPEGSRRESFLPPSFSGLLVSLAWGHITQSPPLSSRDLFSVFPFCVSPMQTLAFGIGVHLNNSEWISSRGL